MATTKRLYVFATFWLACAATALVVAAFSTGAWLTSELLPPPYNGTLRGFYGDISYGLYTGSWRRGQQGQLDQGLQNTIHITCLVGENACAWSDQETDEERLAYVQKVFDDRSSNCSNTSGGSSNSGNSALEYDCSDYPFINMGLWVSTQLFLSVALLLSAISAVLGLINTTTNPKLPALAVTGLFYWNAGAAVADLIILILWGVQYAVTLAHNVAFTEVITGAYISDGNAALGYSYWLVLVAMFTSISSIAVLAFREYLLRIEPPPPTIPDDQNTDGAIFLY